jgi:3',5'-cyclic AMP phosphodiesterase CpdA
MRLLATADLHFNHHHSRPLAERLIEQINGEQNIDALLLIGDTASAEPAVLEECLGRFTFAGAKLFVPGNHELWTRDGDSYALLNTELPQRVAAAGWHWLQDRPFVMGNVAIVGSIGWYDYSFACDDLGIPRRFYEHKISPAAASQFPEYLHLLDQADDVPAHAMEIFARWNDGRFIRLGRSDEAFLEELLAKLTAQLESLAGAEKIVAAVHHLPFHGLVPQVAGAQWQFARAFLGSERIGQTLLRFANVRYILCGHSHFPRELEIEGRKVISIGSGYRHKVFRIIDL